MQTQRYSIQLGVRLKLPSDSSIIAKVSGFTEAGVSGIFARFSGCSDTTVGDNGRECLLQIRILLSTPSVGTAGSDLLTTSTRPPNRFSVWRHCHLGVPQVGLGLRLLVHRFTSRYFLSCRSRRPHRICPCNLASRSTSHHELFALAKMVLNLKDFAANE